MCVSEIISNQYLEIDKPFMIGFYDSDTGETEIIYHSWMDEDICPDFLSHEVTYISIKEVNNIVCIYFEICIWED